MNNSIFNLTFFFNLGAVILAAVGLGFAISYRRTQEGKVSLFLLLTTALATVYYFFQWLANSFVASYISNYSAAHHTFQMPGWFNGALMLFFIILNYSFIVTLMLTVWSAVRKPQEEEQELSQETEKPEEITTEEAPELTPAIESIEATTIEGEVRK